jgi:hypothetical protein
VEVVQAVPVIHQHILHQIYRELILLQELLKLLGAALAAQECFITSPDKNDHMAPAAAAASGVVEVTE